MFSRHCPGTCQSSILRITFSACCTLTVCSDNATAQKGLCIFSDSLLLHARVKDTNLSIPHAFSELLTLLALSRVRGLTRSIRRQLLVWYTLAVYYEARMREGSNESPIMFDSASYKRSDITFFKHSFQLTFLPALTLLYTDYRQLRIKRLLSSFATMCTTGSNPKGSRHRENVSKALYPRKRAYQLSEKNIVAPEDCTGHLPALALQELAHVCGNDAACQAAQKRICLR